MYTCSDDSGDEFATKVLVARGIAANVPQDELMLSIPLEGDLDVGLIKVENVPVRLARGRVVHGPELTKQLGNGRPVDADVPRVSRRKVGRLAAVHTLQTRVVQAHRIATVNGGCLLHQRLLRRMTRSAEKVRVRGKATESVGGFGGGSYTSKRDIWSAGQHCRVVTLLLLFIREDGKAPK